MAINNLCPNPSFEVNLTGWTALSNTQVAQDGTRSLYGQNSMLVTTSGLIPGEGFTGPVVANGGSPATGVISLNFLSTSVGALTFEAVDANTMAVLGSTTVTLDGNSLWDQRAQVSFSLLANQSFQLMVLTAFAPEALQFWVDGCQYETGVSTASPYIDGDQPGCSWNGTAGLSSSTQLYTNATSAHGVMTLSGRATPVVAQTFTTSASGSMTLSGDLNPSGQGTPPVGAVADFALFGLNDLDPAMSYADQNNAGVSTGQAAYASSYGIFVPPIDYPVSGGKYAWRRAAYMGVGFYLTGVPASNEQNFTNVAVNLQQQGSLTPPAYTSPRQIATIIKPTRLNYCTNPSFEVSTAGWSGVGTGTVAQDGTTVPAPAFTTLQKSGNLGPYFNSTGRTPDGVTGLGPFDGGSASYSSQAMALAGLDTGTAFLSGGIGYVMPTITPGQKDNIRFAGQTIPVSGVRGASVLGFLGASAGGAVGGTSSVITVTYSDGTTDTPTLSFSDWTLGGGTQAVGFGNQVAGTMTYRNNINGTSQTINNYIFAQTVAINSAKTVVSITLPTANTMHIFGITQAQASANTTGSFSGKVTVNANQDGIQIAVPNLIVGDSYTVSMFVQAGTALSAITAAAGAGSGAVTGVAGANIATLAWFPLSFTFTATSSTISQVLTIKATGGTGVVYPTSFWVDGILIEAGQVVNPYFDGSYSSSAFNDYQWEGSAGLSRSYYYQQFNVKKFSISEILNQHIPLGLAAPAPVYTTPYTQ